MYSDLEIFCPCMFADTGWKAKMAPLDHPVSEYEFDVLIGADGKRNTLKGKTTKNKTDLLKVIDWRFLGKYI